MTQMNLFAATLKAGDRVRFTDGYGKARESRVYDVASTVHYGPGMLHVYSPWLSILFVTLPQDRLELIDGGAQ